MTDLPAMPALGEAPPAVPTNSRRPQPPRLWPVMVAPVAALVGAIGVQVVLAIALVVTMWKPGAGPPSADEILAAFAGPRVLIALLALGQLAFAAAAFVPAFLSPQPTADRLGILTPRNPRLPWWAWPVLAIAAWLPAALGILLAWPLSTLLHPDGSGIEKIWETASPTESVVLVTLIALLPGVIEESLFRGYIQRRLLQRFRPVFAILISSAMFAAVHLDPVTVVFAFPIGLWLGFMAWRLDSILPGMLAHALINGSWNVLQIASRQGVISDSTTVSITIIGGVLALVAFVVAVLLLRARVNGGTDQIPGALQT